MRARRLAGAFLAAAFLVRRFAGAFLAAALRLAGALRLAAFLTVRRLAGALRLAAFLTVRRLAGAFRLAAFLTVRRLAGAFLAAAFLRFAGFRAVVFRAVVFFATRRFAGLRAVVFFSCLPCGSSLCRRHGHHLSLGIRVRRSKEIPRAYLFTADLKAAPAENFTPFDAAICTGSPVRGLRPVRAAR